MVNKVSSSKTANKAGRALSARRAANAASDPILKIRNIGIAAHIDAGKTTTTERMLYYSGVISRMGEVAEGTTTTDWMTQEQERGISITAAATTFPWRGSVVNLIDTPGHVDFTIEVERSLRVLDGCVAVFCATSGVQPQSETIWRQCDRYSVPRLAFINKCDRVGADPSAVVDQLRTRLGAKPLVLQLPLGLGPSFVGVIDLIRQTIRRWDPSTSGTTFVDEAIPTGQLAEAQSARETLISDLAEIDDRAMQLFIDGSLTEAALREAIRRVTITGAAVPVLVGSAFRNQGVHDLLDAVVDYLPSPVDRPAARGELPDGSVQQVSTDQLAALAFKVQTVNGLPLSYVRIYAGSLTKGTSVFNATKGRMESIDRLLRVFSNEPVDVDRLETGMIGAVVGSRATTGDTLCDVDHPIILDRIYVPPPVMTVAIEPATATDSARLDAVLGQLAAEDPTFSVRTDIESGQTFIAGMGELHLEILLDRMRREFGLTVRAGKPAVAYKETIAQSALAWGEHARDSQPVHAGAVELAVEPIGRGLGLVMENEAPEQALPRRFWPAVEAGVREAVSRGITEGYEVVDVRVVAKDARYHVVDSSELGFKIAGSRAFIDAARAAGPTLLEPLMSVEIVAPDESVGEVMGDLHARRGKITGNVARPGVQTVAGLVPLASMFGYATSLRSKTKGRATFTMQFSNYAEVPKHIRETI